MSPWSFEAMLGRLPEVRRVMERGDLAGIFATMPSFFILNKGYCNKGGWGAAKRRTSAGFIGMS